MVKFEQIQSYALTMVTTAIIIGLGAKILGSGGMQASETDANVNTTLQRGVLALMEYSNWFDEIALVTVAAVIIGLVAMFKPGRS